MLVIIFLGVGFTPSTISFSKIYNFHIKGQGTKHKKIDEFNQKLKNPLKSSGKVLKTAFFNKLYTNENYNLIDKKLADLDPDIIGFAEFRLVDAKEIDYLENYPYQFLPLIKNEFETKVAIYSKHPIEEYKSPKSILSYLTAKIKVEEKVFYFLVLHMAAPVSQDFFTLRNRQINEAATVINNIEKNLQKDESLIVMGDFNLSPWSNYYKKFTSQTDLENVAEGQKINYTWEYKAFPKALRPILQSQIDHIFTSKDLINSGFNTESQLGSDHQLIWTQTLLL
jgi:endonuclease/exonuclease/phosphatase (EEP) superfamily protein YafD